MFDKISAFADKYFPIFFMFSMGYFIILLIMEIIK